jgi:hypothetical protein
VSKFPARHGRHAAYAAAQPHRAPEADHVRELRTRADADPHGCRSSLPRWHTRSARHSLTSGKYSHITYADTGKAWTWRYDPKTGRREPVQDGTRSRVTWLDRQSYLTRFLPVFLGLVSSRDVLARHKVDRDTLLRWVRTESVYAEQRTGRRIIVRAQTVAVLMEVATRTVHRCRSAARELGIYATVYPGRMLGVWEQRKARDAGSPQRGLAAESAFVIPREHAQIGSVSCLQRGATAGHFSSNPATGLPLNSRGEKEQASPARSKKRRRRAAPGYLLAVAVVERLPWARGADPSRFAGLLHRFATAPDPWTADDVVRRVDQVNAQRGWSAVHSPAELRKPAFALLAKTYLTRDVDTVNDHPRLDVFLANERAAAAHESNVRAREFHDRGERCGRPECC